MGRVQGKVALVTGAAKGIGEACSLLLAKEGAKVVVSDLDQAAGEAVVAKIVAAGGQAFFIHQDVTDEASWPATIAATEARFGALHVLVNNAGIAIPGNAVDCTLADWRKTIAVNLDAVFLGTKYAIPAMTGKNGSIINISSIEGIVADPQSGLVQRQQGRRAHLHQVGGAALRQDRPQGARQFGASRLHLDADGRGLPEVVR